MFSVERDEGDGFQRPFEHELVTVVLFKVLHAEIDEFSVCLPICIAENQRCSNYANLFDFLPFV